MDDKDKRLDSELETAAEETPAPAKDKSRPRRFKDTKKDERLKEKNSKKLDKLLKKQKRKEERSDREVLTYEDMPLEEREDPIEPKKKKKKFKVGKIIAATLILVILFSVVFFTFNDNKFTWHNVTNFVKYGLLNQKSDEKFPVDIKSVTVNAGNFMRMGQDICYASESKIQLLNNYGRSEFSVQHAYINPILTVGKKGALVYNLGGSGFQIISRDGKTVYTESAENNIMTADYADNGVYALVTQSSGYLSKLYVYNEKHEQIFSYSFADYNVVSVSLNPNGKQAVVSGISALNGVEVAALYILDFTSETPEITTYENNFIYSVAYFNDKYACAIGKTASYVINTSNGDVTTNEYEGRMLTAYDVNPDTDTYTLSLSTSGDGRNCDIVSYAKNGTDEKSFSLEEEVKDLSTYKGRVAILTSNEVRLYNKDGKQYSSKELTSDPQAVVLYTTSHAYVLCTGYIDTVSL